MRLYGDHLRDCLADSVIDAHEAHRAARSDSQALNKLASRTDFGKVVADTAPAHSFSCLLGSGHDAIHAVLNDTADETVVGGCLPRSPHCVLHPTSWYKRILRNTSLNSSKCLSLSFRLSAILTTFE